METIEHWWNGRPTADGRCDLILRFNSKGPLWEIEVREFGRSRVFEYAVESAARDQLHAALGPAWRRIAAAAPLVGAPH